MKYILTESQFERIAESQEYLNQLLDKINSDGYESLNHREKDALIRISKGEEVYDEPEELPVSDDVYDPNRMFLHYVSRYKEVEIDVDELIFRLEPVGTQTIEVLGQYHTFLIEPNFEENEVLMLDNETDEVDHIKYKNVPETTEGMRKLAVNFVYQKLTSYIRSKI